MKKLFLLMLMCLMALVGCKEAPVDLEIHSFDIHGTSEDVDGIPQIRYWENGGYFYLTWNVDPESLYHVKLFIEDQRFYQQNCGTGDPYKCQSRKANTCFLTANGVISCGDGQELDISYLLGVSVTLRLTLEACKYNSTDCDSITRLVRFN